MTKENRRDLIRDLHERRQLANTSGKERNWARHQNILALKGFSADVLSEPRSIPALLAMATSIPTLDELPEVDVSDIVRTYNATIEQNQTEEQQ